MAVCDVCNSPGIGEIVSAATIENVAFRSGFNPFKLKLAVNSSALLGNSDPIIGRIMLLHQVLPNGVSAAIVCGFIKIITKKNNRTMMIIRSFSNSKRII